MKAVSPRQADVLAAIKAYQQEHSCGPSLSDLALAIGVIWTGTVRCHLVALEKKGLVRLNQGQPRSIVVVDDGMVTVERAGLEMAAELARTAGAADVAGILDGLLASAKKVDVHD